MDSSRTIDSPDLAERPERLTLESLYRTMVRIRRFEERLAVLFKRGRLPGFVHLYIGQEAVATGVCSVLRREDRITSTHRGHGHLIAKGADVNGMMAELFGKADGLCRGKGGSMHTVDFSLGIIGTNGIVGGGIPIAVGAAWSARQLGQDLVAVAFFGDGASNQGVFLESMNLAQIWQLPVVFVCEANGYSEWTPTEKLTAGRIADRGVALGIPGHQIDGNDVIEVRAVTEAAVARARAGEGPTLIEARTMRWHGHNEGEEAFSGNYRPADEVASWQERDPLASLRARLTAWHTHSSAELEAIWVEEGERVDAAVAFAENSPTPDPEEALRDVFFEADHDERADV
jgi:pyruvate dehydrogenase E1 component alpha subunit